MSTSLLIVPNCSICQEPLSSELITPSGCGHVYHQICLEAWLTTRKVGTQKKCPLCRTSISEKSLVKLQYDCHYDDSVEALSVDPDNASLSQLKAELKIAQSRIKDLKTSLHRENDLANDLKLSLEEERTSRMNIEASFQIEKSHLNRSLEENKNLQILEKNSRQQIQMMKVELKKRIQIGKFFSKSKKEKATDSLHQLISALSKDELSQFVHKRFEEEKRRRLRLRRDLEEWKAACIDKSQQYSRLLKACQSQLKNVGLNETDISLERKSCESKDFSDEEVVETVCLESAYGYSAVSKPSSSIENLRMDNKPQIKHLHHEDNQLEQRIDKNIPNFDKRIIQPNFKNNHILNKALDLLYQNASTDSKSCTNQKSSSPPFSALNPFFEINPCDQMKDLLKYKKQDFMDASLPHSMSSSDNILKHDQPYLSKCIIAGNYECNQNLNISDKSETIQNTLCKEVYQDVSELQEIVPSEHSNPINEFSDFCKKFPCPNSVQHYKTSENTFKCSDSNQSSKLYSNTKLSGFQSIIKQPTLKRKDKVVFKKGKMEFSEKVKKPPIKSANIKNYFQKLKQ